MKKLDSVELWLLKKAVECKMKNLMDIIKETESVSVTELYSNYVALHTKLSIIENEYSRSDLK